MSQCNVAVTDHFSNSRQTGLGHTDGRNPVPHDMYETLLITGYLPYQLVSQISSINSITIITHHFCSQRLNHLNSFAAENFRQAYPWREASHPLLRRRTLRADGATVFGCHFGGHVLALLSHHIVHGEVQLFRCLLMDISASQSSFWDGQQ